MKNKILPLLIGIALTGPALAAPTVTISVNPTNATVSAFPVVTWSSSETTSCEASGGWSGTKDTIGSEQLPEIFATTTYTLTCSGSGGGATLTWTPPTTRTDGSPLTNLAQYNIFMGTTAGNLAVYETILSGGTTYTLNNLSGGMKYFSMSAIDSDGLESVQSNTASKDIILPSAAGSATVNITTLPRPPVLTAVQDAIVYEINTLGNGDIRLGRVVGEISYEVTCGSDLIVAPNYYEVPKEAVTLRVNRVPKSDVLVAECREKVAIS